MKLEIMIILSMFTWFCLWFLNIINLLMYEINQVVINDINPSKKTINNSCNAILSVVDCICIFLTILLLNVIIVCLRKLAYTI